MIDPFFRGDGAIEKKIGHDGVIVSKLQRDGVVTRKFWQDGMIVTPWHPSMFWPDPPPRGGGQPSREVGKKTALGPKKNCPKNLKIGIFSCFLPQIVGNSAQF